MGVKVLFGILFALFALSIMFYEAEVHVDLNSKPSMALTHMLMMSSGGMDGMSMPGMSMPGTNTGSGGMKH